MLAEKETFDKLFALRRFDIQISLKLTITVLGFNRLLLKLQEQALPFLLQQHHLPRLDEIACLEAVETDSKRPV